MLFRSAPGWGRQHHSHPRELRAFFSCTAWRAIPGHWQVDSLPLSHQGSPRTLVRTFILALFSPGTLSMHTHGSHLPSQPKTTSSYWYSDFIPPPVILYHFTVSLPILMYWSLWKSSFVGWGSPSRCLFVFGCTLWLMAAVPNLFGTSFTATFFFVEDKSSTDGGGGWFQDASSALHLLCTLFLLL